MRDREEALAKEGRELLGELLRTVAALLSSGPVHREEFLQVRRGLAVAVAAAVAVVDVAFSAVVWFQLPNCVDVCSSDLQAIAVVAAAFAVFAVVAVAFSCYCVVLAT